MIISLPQQRVAQPAAPPRSNVPEHTAADEDLEHRLMNFLHERQVPGSEGLSVEAYGGTVLVSGRLKSPHAKWLCVECCRRVAGVIRLVDGVQAPQRRVQLRLVGDAS